ncbi:P-loop containing nucleoside triphosphate hydrolase protein [Pyronema omphalodes]|nr:P-loop containing nucleoside triphosphate hydrolase protein [Pyronema omphalodes]
MVRPKKQSKRVPVRLRHKIEKRSAEKQRKERKNAKKHPELGKKKPAALNIPNSFPYKEQILNEIEEQRRLRVEEQQRKREQSKLKKKADQQVTEDGDVAMDAEEDESDDESMDGMDEDSGDEAAGGNAMAALLASARAKAAQYEAAHDDSDDEDDQQTENYAKGNKDTSRKNFDKMFKEVVSAADVILYVLDARDPNGTRSREVERQIMSMDGGEKRLILILNKIDLVPPPVLKGWLTYLKRSFPTLPLKASNGAPNAQSFDHKSLTVQGTSQALLSALKSFAQSKQLKRSVSVGVIGYPNVGKSSVINALTGRLGGSSAACPVGAEAGLTTSLREVKLDKKLKILDSPGIVFPSTDNEKGTAAEKQARLVLLNAVPPKQIDDPVAAVQLLIKRFSTSQTLFSKLLDVYGIPPIPQLGLPQVTKSFLTEVARKRGRLGKGGIPNIESAAVAVIMDWRDGRIQGWIDPPIATASANAGIQTAAGTVEADQKEVVSQWMEEFKLEGLDFGDDETNEVEMQG